MSSAEWLKLSEPSENVLLIELNRQPVNAWSEEFWRAYEKLFDGISSTHPHIRVIVLASALPKIWTAGLDLNDTSILAPKPSLDPYRRSLPLKEHIHEFQHAIGAPERCVVPVIAAVHGLCIGLGMDIISACDVRYASSDTTFSIKEVDVGLAADIGSLAYLPKITGNQSLARELAFSTRIFSPAEAEKLGIISRTVEGGREGVIGSALELAKLIASKSPVAVAGTKRLLIHSRDHSLSENLEYTALWNSVALQATDVAESFSAIKGKRTPSYSPLKRSAKL